MLVEKGIHLTVGNSHTKRERLSYLNNSKSQMKQEEK